LRRERKHSPAEPASKLAMLTVLPYPSSPPEIASKFVIKFGHARLKAWARIVIKFSKVSYRSSAKEVPNVDRTERQVVQQFATKQLLSTDAKDP
jgi:hypothetical protein